MSFRSLIWATFVKPHVAEVIHHCKNECKRSDAQSVDFCAHATSRNSWQVTSNWTMCGCTCWRQELIYTTRVPTHRHYDRHPQSTDDAKYRNNRRTSYPHCPLISKANTKNSVLVKRFPRFYPCLWVVNWTHRIAESTTSLLRPCWKHGEGSGFVQIANEWN